MFRPAKQHDVHLSSNLNMRVLEWEASAPGAPTVVCVHGLLRRAEDFIDFATMNPQWRVLAPDVRGRGGSDWGQPKDYTLKQYVLDMQDMFRHFNLSQTYWVGTSMGGLIGMLLAARNPGLITKMVLNDVGPHVPGKAMRRIYSYGKVYPTFRDYTQAKSLYRKVYAPFKLTEEQLDNLTQVSIRETDDGYAPHYDPNIGAAMRFPLFPFTMWRDFRRITAPMLVIRGAESDVLLPRTVKAMQNLTRSHVSAYEEPDVGHAPLLNKPRTLDAIRAFFSQPAV
ncbi:MAG: alpha/beta fold hydrolase [Proteobacteria bacterium]|nr:alpha/beta fold hydrolase [Pseudomonadota bacterium]